MRRHCRPEPLRGGRVGRYLRARLHRRLFVWFCAAILVTVAAVAGAIHLLGGGWPSSYRQEVARVEALVSHQFARVWADPAERDALARSLAEELEAGVALEDAGGQRLSAYGPPCSARGAFRVPVARAGEAVGSVTACFPRLRPGAPLRMVTVLAVIIGVLWAVSGIISRRLAHPLGELSRVAREIGDGNLRSRMRIDRRSVDEVALVGETLNDMATRIAKQLADQRELLAAVSHELRTPLSRIRLLTEMTRATEAPARGGEGAEGEEAIRAQTTSGDEAAQAGARLRTKLMDDLDREVIEIDALVGDLLASSRLDFEALTVSRLVPAEVAVRAVERAGLDPSVLEVEESAPGWLEADATLLARALANLLENARVHGGGVARMRVRARGDGVAFEVEDGGPGFAVGEEGRVFAPFYRGEGKRAEKGVDRAGGETRGALGLGLSLCKRIAEAHGGTAYAENRAEGGARVGLQLDLRADLDPDRGSRSRAEWAS